MPTRRRSRRRLQTRGDEILGGLGGFLVGYMGAEAVLGRFMHPIHWITAGIVAGLSYGGVWLWYFWRRAWREEHEQRNR